jgi:hypothetical protein
VAKMWGIYDTQDHLWLGSNDAGTGPKVFAEDEVVNGTPLGADALIIARIAAQVGDVRAGWKTGRSQPREYHGQATKLRDEVPLKDTTANVLRKMENGSII